MNDDGPIAARQQRSLAAAWPRTQLSVEELWSRYFALGGDAGPLEVDAYLHGLATLPALQRDLLAHAVNERLDELVGAHRADYSRPVRESSARSQPLAALVELLDGVLLAPPERLAAVADAAGKTLGVGLTLYLVDYEGRMLVPLVRTDASASPPPQAVETTLAGQVFRQLRMLPAETTPPRLWVPLMDGVERIGVLEVEIADRDELYDAGLRAQCRWLSMLLGHLVVALDPHGDAFQRLRLSAPRTPGAQLIWSLLPPLTAGVDDFVITGAVEPRERVSGDAFDYSLSESTAHLLILDAVGHDLESGLIAATAISAYRAARYRGAGLPAQARAIDEALRSGPFGAAAFATGVLAEVDLPSGRLRYLNAGHPAPLIMRSGKVVKPLTGAQRLPLGLGTDTEQPSVGEEKLEPDDWLVLFTDGITEARNPDGAFFGQERLVDFLRREAATGYPPPETARRLMHAVLDHQGGSLQDDATVVLARWTNSERIDS